MEGEPRGEAGEGAAEGFEVCDAGAVGGLAGAALDGHGSA
jgi:hypothetical protein